ncbi:hypothetical protein AQUCO_02300099v1 [Aquilegia coerulea]|uniref:Uncharacterized protein n=1 Tax=Aquilegia coerulea TaxID=218851 RepID=A0A2G5DC06_AQUCA|nr:hypothetical protein AQUCO_02300099v1 [Aquilegia coerulea]
MLERHVLELKQSTHIVVFRPDSVEDDALAASRLTVFRSNPFLGSDKDTGYVSDLARQSTLRGPGMFSFSVRISAVMSLLDSPVEIRENSILFSMDTEFCEISPELSDHFEIFEHIRGFNVTIVTSANTQDKPSQLESIFSAKIFLRETQ